MKYLLFLLSFSQLVAFGQEKSKTIIDKIVAQVGDNIILKSDIETQKLQYLQGGMQVKGKETECEILEDLMFQNLLLNQAALDSIEITDAQVDSEMENRVRVIENQIGGRQKMEEFYGKTITQIKNEFRPLIRKRMLSEEMERRITEEVVISPREIEQFFKNIPTDSIPLINSQLSFQQIVIFPEVTKDDKLKAFNKLSEIRVAILGGKSFETQARIHSEDPGSASQGGKLSATRGMMVPQFEAAVFSLKEMEISPVFETDYGYHIVQLVERKGDDYTCRHILIVPEFNPQSLNSANLKMDECYKKLKSNEITWDKAVETYSNDLNTKYNRGIITNPITGEQTWSMENLNEVDQQIYLLTDALNKGDISAPSLYFDFNERKQGIRIVRLMDRTSPHQANLKDDYSLIQRAALNDKRQKVIQAWTKSKLQNAYIRIDQEFGSCTFSNEWKSNL
jgi:peptidyl-prolyl cis-trans isomerase SurA